MDRSDKILQNEKFREYMLKTALYERGRIYCLHDMRHALDVARIAYIKSLEAGGGIDREIIYAAALIHDVGRCMQYENGTPHELASVELGRGILAECGFNAAETETILTAVAEHRTDKKRSPLGALLYGADNESRMCMLCGARDTCKWDKSDMNMEIKY